MVIESDIFKFSEFSLISGYRNQVIRPSLNTMRSNEIKQAAGNKRHTPFSIPKPAVFLSWLLNELKLKFKNESRINTRTICTNWYLGGIPFKQFRHLFANVTERQSMEIHFGDIATESHRVGL